MYTAAVWGRGYISRKLRRYRVIQLNPLLCVARRYPIPHYIPIELTHGHLRTAACQLRVSIPKAPPESNLGARFLLLFVAATIPAGILAKRQYGDILANVDLLHGTSESLLSVSNFLLALGLARAVARAEGHNAEEVPTGVVSALKPLGLTAALCGVGYGAVSALGGSSEAISALSLGVEPANALSFPTWMVHVSSVSEWCAAMALAWRLGEVGPNSAWKGFSLSMAPSLAGALTACTFHLYYNSPSLAALVPLQAALTLVGKASCICAIAPSATRATTGSNDM